MSVPVYSSYCPLCFFLKIMGYTVLIVLIAAIVGNSIAKRRFIK